MRKVTIPAYKYNKEENTVVDIYICSICYDLIKEVTREAKGRALSRYSLVYFSTCSNCKDIKNSSKCSKCYYIKE